jgi:aminoglycoside phosphotransferase family enzyme/predicted kinase
MGAAEEHAEKLLRGLMRAEAYPHAVRKLELHETHISWVVLTGDLAYKIKKPVRFNFVDYSTLALRRACCEEELRLNRRLAPEVYLDVTPIAGPAEACRVAGEGPPCEYAVRMRQFEQEAMLEPALAAGRVSLEQFERFGRHLAAFHRSIAGAAVSEGLGMPERIARNVSDVWELLRTHAGAPWMPRVEALDSWRQAEETRLRAVFTARRREGFVRECHGDLHLGNLLLLRDAITAFDGIEFNPGLRWIDVLSEVAFLAMDLEADGRRDAAFVFLNAYLEETGDYAGLATLPYYLTYRAAVRSAVTLLRGAQLTNSAEKTPIEALAERYLDEAERCRGRRATTLTITHGVSGSGKTVASSVVLAAEGSVRLRSDVERKRMLGLDAATPAPEDAYSVEATERVYARLAELAEMTIRAGFSVIVDATFLRRAQRAEFARIAERLGVAFRILECHAPREVLRERVRGRGARGGDASDATVAVLEAQLRADEPLDADERAHAIKSA